MGEYGAAPARQSRTRGIFGVRWWPRNNSPEIFLSKRQTKRQINGFDVFSILLCLGRTLVDRRAMGLPEMVLSTGVSNVVFCFHLGGILRQIARRASRGRVARL